MLYIDYIENTESHWNIDCTQRVFVQICRRRCCIYIYSELLSKQKKQNNELSELSFDGQFSSDCELRIAGGNHKAAVPS